VGSEGGRREAWRGLRSWGGFFNALSGDLFILRRSFFPCGLRFDLDLFQNLSCRLRAWGCGARLREGRAR
jgi:hypothetical protein